jgi:hypothetical protein
MNETQINNQEKSEKNDPDNADFISDNNEELSTVNFPLWLSVSESAKFGGFQSKTIRRAIQAKSIKYAVKNNRYLIDFSSLIIFINSKIKLRNKFAQYGLGQYIKEWKD